MFRVGKKENDELSFVEVAGESGLPELVEGVVAVDVGGDLVVVVELEEDVAWGEI